MQKSQPVTPHHHFHGMQMTRPVIFPDADIKALRALNDLLLASGAVKRDADAAAER